MSGNVPSGLTPFRNINLGLTAVAVRATAGKIYWYFITNQHATLARYVHFYDSAQADVTVGSTTPTLTLAFPPEAAANVSLEGINFDVAISVAASTAIGATGAPAANDVVVNLGHA